MKRLAIFGASGHGKVVADAAIAAGWDEVVFFDDAWPTLAAVGPWAVSGATAELVRDRGDFEGVTVAIGNNSIRLDKMRQIEAAGIPLLSILHPASTVSPYAAIGAGTVVFAGGVVNAFAHLGKGCIVNTGATIDHDCLFADGVHASPGAHVGGQVIVGAATWIGIGACIRQCVSIGENVVIGAGAAVIGDIESGQCVVGVPAHSI